MNPPTPDDGRGSASEEHLGDGRACAGFWCRMPRSGLAACPLATCRALSWRFSSGFRKQR